MSIGKKLKILRGKKNQGDVGLAIWPDEKLNFKQAQQRISRIEKYPDENMPLGILKKLAAYYGKPISYFVEEGGGTPCGDNPALLDAVERLTELYTNPESGSVRTLEAGLAYIYEVAEKEKMLNKILEKLNTLEERLAANSVRYNKRLDDMEKLLKSDAADQKTGVGGV